MLGDRLTFDDVSTTHAALVTPQQTVTWPELKAQVESRAAQLRSLGGKRIGLLLAANVDAVVQLLSLAEAGVHTFLIGSDLQQDVLQEWAADLGLASVFRPDGSRIDFEPDLLPDSPGAVTILTSGTTGKPKAAEHTWDSLTRPVRVSPPADLASGPRWLLTYRPHLYAGLQVMMQCLLNRGTLVMPPAGSSAEEVARLALSSKVQFASATPSYWRWLLTLASDEYLPCIPLQQITLGGEAVDQSTLDALHRKFPNTRLVHIYATTELGRCFSVTDGKAGFPKRFLDQVSPDGVEMRIDEEAGGELVVRSANAMSKYDRSEIASPQDAWFPTGDLVNVDGERVFFVGRKSDVINVGGNKVYPIEVEKVIRSVPGVADTRVYGEASSIVGELVKCDLVVATGRDADEVEKAVREKTLSDLSTYQRPRFISIVKQIPRTTAGKTDRN